MGDGVLFLLSHGLIVSRYKKVACSKSYGIINPKGDGVLSLV